MRDTDLLQLALGIMPPWLVEAATFDAEKRRLDIEIDFATGGRFPCPDCAKPNCPTHDTVKKTWRHLDFFQHQAFLHARTPRITCPDCGAQLRVPAGPSRAPEGDLAVWFPLPAARWWDDVVRTCTSIRLCCDQDHARRWAA